MLLVVLAIMLILITRSGSDLVDIGGVKIEGAGGASECQVLCYKCCHDQYEDCSETSSEASGEIRACKCIDNNINSFEC